MKLTTFSLCFILRLLPLCWGALLVALCLPQWSYAGNTALILDSPPGDWVGSGQTWYYTTAEATFSASRNEHNGVSVVVYSGDYCWHLDFSGINLAPLEVGTYEHARRYFFEVGPNLVPIDPGLDVWGGECSYGHACNELTGGFVVTELVWGMDQSVASFHARFTQYCEELMPPLRGEIYFEATEPLTPPHHFTSPVVAYATERQLFRHQIATSRSDDNYSVSDLPLGMTLNPASGLISGIPLENGHFEIVLTATGPSGTITTQLDLTVDPPGRSTGSYTAIYLLSEIGGPMIDAHSVLQTLDEGRFNGSGGVRGGNRAHVSMGFTPWTAFTNHDYSGTFGLTLWAEEGNLLTPGTYVDNDYEVLGTGPQIIFDDDHASYYTGRASFTLREFDADPNTRLQHLRGSFVDRARSSEHAFRGWV
jgi:hypothetical protein